VVRVIEREDLVLLEVEDSGPGMTHEDASHAFDRFWQADSSRSERSGLVSPSCELVDATS